MSRKTKAAEFIGEGYKIHVTGRNVLVTDSMQDYAIEKISKIEKFSERIIDVVVTMDIQHIDHRVDIVMKVDNIKIKSTATSENMYASIDMATDKIQRQLKRYKSRISEHHNRNLASIDMNVNVISTNDPLTEINDEIEEETQRRIDGEFAPHEVVDTEQRPLKTLNRDEAIMKMELSGDSFLIYRAEEDQKLKVIYRRSDENYGIIEVES